MRIYLHEWLLQALLGYNGFMPERKPDIFEGQRPKILMLDDEVAIAQLVGSIFEAEGFEVAVFFKPQDALEAAAKTDFDLAIVDIMMPGMDGFEFTRRLQSISDASVVFLTAKDEETDILVGFALGADDYIVKPFKPRELVARVKARLRKRSLSDASKGQDSILEAKGIELSRREHTASLYGEPLALTPKEFDILACLLENAGSPVSTADLYSRVWNMPPDSSSANTVMVHIRHLRCKLAEVDSSTQFISTAWGVGYMIAASAS